MAMRGESDEYLTLYELAFMIGTRTRIIERLWALDLIQPARTEPEPCFSTDVVFRVRRLMRLHDQLGISWTSMELVLELLDRVDTLEARLRQDG